MYRQNLLDTCGKIPLTRSRSGRVAHDAPPWRIRAMSWDSSSKSWRRKGDAARRNRDVGIVRENAGPLSGQRDQPTSVVVEVNAVFAPIVAIGHQSELTSAEWVEGMGDLERFGRHRSDRVHLTVSSNGKIERWHKTLKGDCIRVSAAVARRRPPDRGRLRLHYNTVRLHCAIGYVTPKDKLDGRDTEIFAARDRKLAEARERRQQLRQAACDPAQRRTGFTLCHRLRRRSRRGHHRRRPATARLPVPHQPRRPTTRPVPACTARRPAPAAASPSTLSSTSSTASNAADPAMPSTSGPTPPAKRLYDAALDLCQRLHIPVPELSAPSPRQHFGTERRNP